MTSAIDCDCDTVYPSSMHYASSTVDNVDPKSPFAFPDDHYTYGRHTGSYLLCSTDYELLDEGFSSSVRVWIKGMYTPTLSGYVPLRVGDVVFAAGQIRGIENLTTADNYGWGSDSGMTEIWSFRTDISSSLVGANERVAFAAAFVVDSTPAVIKIVYNTFSTTVESFPMDFTFHIARAGDTST